MAYGTTPYSFSPLTPPAGAGFAYTPLELSSILSGNQGYAPAFGATAPGANPFSTSKVAAPAAKAIVGSMPSVTLTSGETYTPGSIGSPVSDVPVGPKPELPAPAVGLAESLGLTTGTTVAPGGELYTPGQFALNNPDLDSGTLDAYLRWYNDIDPEGYGLTKSSGTSFEEFYALDSKLAETGVDLQASLDANAALEDKVSGLESTISGLSANLEALMNQPQQQAIDPAILALLLSGQNQGDQYQNPYGMGYYF